MEIWKDIEGFEGYYQISNEGRVRSVSRYVNKGSGRFWQEGKILKQSKSKCGYWMVTLKVNGKPTTRKTHRFIALAFIPKIQGKEIINHKDGNKLNNSLSNLEWCDFKENALHSLENQLKPNNFNKFKEIIKNEYLKGDISLKSVCEKYQVSKNAIKRYFEKEGIEIQPNTNHYGKYKINKKELVSDFEKGLRNIELQKKYKCSYHTIANYRYKWKKGVFI